MTVKMALYVAFAKRMKHVKQYMCN